MGERERKGEREREREREGERYNQRRNKGKRKSLVDGVRNKSWKFRNKEEG